MDSIDLSSDFDAFGFLGKGIQASTEQFRAENIEWFQLAEDCSNALMRAAQKAMTLAKTNSMAPEAIAVRVLLRSCGTFQAVIMLTERGMVPEGRTLARCILEGAFAIAALHDNPDVFLAMLKEDYETSRRLQGEYILSKQLVSDAANAAKLRTVVDGISKGKHISPKVIAGLGPLAGQYLAYQRLSDDSAHISARSLDRHVERDVDKSGWVYRWGPGSAHENAATLHEAILGAIPIGVGVTALLGDEQNNAEFSALADRFQLMPPVPAI